MLCVRAVRRAALREAAKTWAFAEWQGTPGMRQRSAVAATDGSRKTCKFMVDLAAASPSANASTLFTGAAADEDNAQRAAMAFGEGGPGGAPVALSSGSRSGRVRLTSIDSCIGRKVSAPWRAVAYAVHACQTAADP